MIARLYFPSLRLSCLTFAVWALFCSICEAQPKPVSDPAAFDFWVGTWDITFTSSAGPGKGVTTVRKIFGNSALVEDFFHTEGPSTGFEGYSIAAVDRQAGIWKRTWIDNGGGFQSFEAFSDGDRIYFLRHYTSGDQPMVARMSYLDIESGRFSWIWEVSSDSGSTWRTLITTEYTHRKD